MNIETEPEPVIQNFIIRFYHIIIIIIINININIKLIKIYVIIKVKIFVSNIF